MKKLMGYSYAEKGELQVLAHEKTGEDVELLTHVTNDALPSVTSIIKHTIPPAGGSTASRIHDFSRGHGNRPDPADDIPPWGSGRLQTHCSKATNNDLQ